MSKHLHRNQQQIVAADWKIEKCVHIFLKPIRGADYEKYVFFSENMQKMIAKTAL